MRDSKCLSTGPFRAGRPKRQHTGKDTTGRPLGSNVAGSRAVRPASGRGFCRRTEFVADVLGFGLVWTTSVTTYPCWESPDSNYIQSAGVRLVQHLQVQLSRNIVADRDSRAAVRGKLASVEKVSAYPLKGVQAEAASRPTKT